MQRISLLLPPPPTARWPDYWSPEHWTAGKFPALLSFYSNIHFLFQESIWDTMLHLVMSTEAFLGYEFLRLSLVLINSFLRDYLVCWPHGGRGESYFRLTSVLLAWLKWTWFHLFLGHQSLQTTVFLFLILNGASASLDLCQQLSLLSGL